MVDGEIQTVESPTPSSGRSILPSAAGGGPSTARSTTEPGPTNGGSEDPFELRYASEARAEQLTLITLGQSVRRGDSDHIEVGLGLAESGPQSYVQGTDRLDVGGTYTEHTGGDGITQSTRMSTTVRGHLNLKGKGDTGILGGTFVDTHIGPEVLAAGMSDDLVVGVGVRTTVAGDLWLCGLMGMEEKLGIAAVDGALVELYGMSFEREYGAGLHNAGAVNFSGPTFVTQAAGFRPLLKAMTGPRNLVPGAGAPAGGASASPPPAAPGAGSGSMLANPSIATGADTIVGVEDTEDGRQLLRVIVDVHVDAAPARTSDTADNLGDAQRLAEMNEAAESGGSAEDAAKVRDEFLRRVNAEVDVDVADQHLVVVEDASGERTVTLTDGSAYDNPDWQDDFAGQQIDYPETQHVDQAGDGANPPAAAGDGAEPDGRTYHRRNPPRISEDPKTFDYEKVIDYAGRGRWDRLLSDDPGSSTDGHAYAIILESQDQSNTYVNDVLSKLVGSEPNFYSQHNLQDAGETPGDQYRKLRTLRDALAADPGPDSARRAREIQQAMTDIEEGVHSRMYAGLETAETVYSQRPLLPDNVDRNQLSAILADRQKVALEEMMPLGDIVGRTDVEEARMLQLSDQITAISNVQETLSQGYDPIHYLDGMISLRTRTNGPDGAEAYKALQADLQGIIDAMTPIRQALADADTSGVALTRFEFDAVSDREVLDVITHNRGSLSDTHTRATTQAQYMLTDLDVAGSPRVKEALEAELASLPETPENAQRIQELNNALMTLDQRLSSPHSLSPTQVEEMMRAELSTLPNTPENVQRIRELNNGLITLDQRMRFIMGDALLWAEQVGTTPPKGAVDGKTTQTAWFLSQKSGTHLDAALQMDETFQAGSSYDLHLANFYDLAARDLRHGVDPTETLEGLSQSIYLDTEVRRAAQTVLDDMRGAYGGPIPDMALTPGVLEEAIHPRATEDPALNIAEHLSDYWNPKLLSGDIEPAQSGTKKWWKSLKGVKKRVKNVLTTVQGIHTPDRFKGAWKGSMLTTGSSGADSTPRRLGDIPSEAPNVITYRQSIANPDDARDAVRQNLNITPSQLVPDSPSPAAGQNPDSLEDTLPPAPLAEADGSGAPVSDRELTDLDEVEENQAYSEILISTRKHEAILDAMEVMGRNIGQGDIPEEQARIQRNLWEQITSSVAEGYDPRNTYLDMRASAEADGALSSSDSQYAYLRVYDDITRLEADPTLFHIDHPKAMSDWNAVGEKDRVTPNNEAYFHMQEGTRVSNQAAQDILQRLDSTIPPEELRTMEFDDVITRIRRIYQTAADLDDTAKTREISGLLDSLDSLMREQLAYRRQKAAIARAKANELLPHRYNDQQLLRRIEGRNDDVQLLPVDPEGDPALAPEVNERVAKLTSKQQQTWDVIWRNLRNYGTDPQRTAEDFLAAAELNKLPQDEINLYQSILDEVVVFKQHPRSQNMAAFPDRNNRLYVLNDLYETRDTLKAEQVQLDALDALDPEQTARYKVLEFEINTYDLLADRTKHGYDPLTEVQNLRRDTEEIGQTSAELESLRRIEANLEDLLEGPDAKLAEATDWVSAAEAQMAEDLADGNQSSAAKMKESLDQIDEHARRVLQQALRDVRSDPSQPLPKAMQEEIVDKANYNHARGHLLKMIEDNTKAGKHENAARVRTALDELDDYPEALLRDTFVNAEAQRDANQRKLGANLDPDDYVNQMIPYLDHARETARKNQLAGEPYELDVLEADLWDTIVRRTESDEYDPLATAEDLFATVMITIHDRTGLTPDEIEAELMVYQKVLDIVTYTIRPDVPGRGQVGEAWEYARVPTGFRPADPNAVVPGMDDPVPTVRIILNNAMSSNAFLEEAARRQESGGVESVEEWFGSQSARLDQMREGDGDLMAQPGGGAQYLPPGWNRPAEIDNPQPKLDSTGARWVSDGPSTNNGGQLGDDPHAEIGALDEVPVREKPLPDSGGASSPNQGDIGDTTVREPVNPALDGSSEPTGPENLAQRPPVAPDPAYVPVHAGGNEPPVYPEDSTREVLGERPMLQDFDAYPPDTPGGKYYIQVEGPMFGDSRPLVGDEGSLWGVDPDHVLRVTHPHTGALMDPSDFEIRVGTEGSARLDPETGEYGKPDFFLHKVYDGTMTGPPIDQSEIDQLLEFARARRRPRYPDPVDIAGPYSGRQQLNLDAVLDALPPAQLDEAGAPAGPNAGGVFYPTEVSGPDRDFPAALPEGVTMRDRYRDLADGHIAMPDAEIGSVRGVDYVLAPPTASVVPEVPTLALAEDPARRIPGIVPDAERKKGQKLPVIRLEKAHQEDILAGVPLTVESSDLGRPLRPGEYIVEARHRGKIFRMVFQGETTFEADLRVWLARLARLQ